MNKPLVSVIMITYGHEKYIEQAIYSVLMQESDFEIELVISNDKSPDGTDAIIQKILKEHPNSSRINYLNNNKNLGMMPNFVNAFNKSKGDFIAICDGDDYWTDKFKLKKQFDFLNQYPNISFVFHSSQTINVKGILNKYYTNKKFIDKQIVPVDLFLENGSATFSTASAFFTRNVLENTPDWFANAHVGDFPLIFLALEKGDIGFLNDCMCVYRLVSEGSWSSNNNSLKKRYKNYQKFIKLNKIINKNTNGKYRAFLNFSIISYVLRRVFFFIKNKIKN